MDTVLIVVVAVLALGAVVFVMGGGGSRVDSADARGLVESGATLLDVRTPGEFGSGHIDGAKNIPVAELSGRLGEVDKDKPVVVYCRSGARSAKAAGILKNAGYEAHNLGPMSAW